MSSTTASSANINQLAAQYADMQRRQQNEPSWLRNDGKEKQQLSPAGVESTKTVVCYLLNLVSMILMCILVMGILVISLIIWFEGSLSVDPIIFVHLTIPGFVLALNLYIIMLEDTEEEKFFKNQKKTGAGKGIFLVNFALIATFLALSFTAYLKFIVGKTA